MQLEVPVLKQTKNAFLYLNVLGTYYLILHLNYWIIIAIIVYIDIIFTCMYSRAFIRHLMYKTTCGGWCTRGITCGYNIAKMDLNIWKKVRWVMCKFAKIDSRYGRSNIFFNTFIPVWSINSKNTSIFVNNSDITFCQLMFLSVWLLYKPFERSV